MAFASDGALATGSLKNTDLETKLSNVDAAPVTTHTSVEYHANCEEKFSNDGKYLATVVPGNELNVIIHDRKTGQLHRRFSSPWRQLDNHPYEWAYNSAFLGGFLPDDSLVLWRYVSQPAASSGRIVDLHMEQWSIEGKLLSDLSLGDLDDAWPVRQPIAMDGFSTLWLPGGCGSACFQVLKVSGLQTARAGELKLPQDLSVRPIPLSSNRGFLAVIGKQQTSQKAVLLDSSGQIQKQVKLPYFPNLLGPLVPDWFGDHELEITPDGQIAALARTRVAWVLVDTDRDWGSEIMILKTGSLAVDAVLKTGKGGIQALAVDHRNGFVRLVGFWKGRWHDLKYDEDHPGRWKENAG